MSGKGRRYTERLIGQIKAGNPGVKVRQGTRHWVIYAPGGRRAGILPFSQRAEGISPNLVAQFERAGIKISNGGK